MRWSAKLGRFAGIDVYVHVTFVALLGYLALVYWTRTGTLGGVLDGLSMILTLFLCVLLHEYGHALTARRFGIRTRYITLLPIGGLALLESMPKDPRQEILVALAGPAVNLVIAAGTYALILASGRSGGPLETDMTRMGLLSSLLAANLALAVFNLLPAFPMDGGRVFRALLSLQLDRVRATRIAAFVGRALAVCLGVVGLTGEPLLILIAVFVWIGAGAEADAITVDARLARRPAARAMTTSFATLAPADPLARAADLARAGSQAAFPVVDGDRVVGMLTRGAILRLRQAAGASEIRVSEVMAPAVTADVGATLAELLGNIEAADSRLVFILRRGQLVGILDLERVTESLRLEPSLGR